MGRSFRPNVVAMAGGRPPRLAPAFLRVIFSAAWTGYAESRDGIRWTKPKLGTIAFRGSKDNNLIWAKRQHYDFMPFREPTPASITHTG